MTVSDTRLDRLAIAVTALRDLYMGYPADQCVSPDGSSGVDNLVLTLVTELRGSGADDEGAWDTPATAGIPVSKVIPMDRELLEELELATTAICDLGKGFPHGEIGARGNDNGLGPLVRDLVGVLRGRGIDDEGGWDCDVTWDISVAYLHTP